MKQITKLNQGVFLKKEIEKLNTLGVISDEKVERIERLNSRLEIIEKVGELILSGEKTPIIAEKLNINENKVRGLSARYGFKKVKDRVFYFELPKKREKLLKALEIGSHKKVREIYHNLDDRSISRLRNETYFNLNEVKKNEIKKSLLQTRDFIKTGKKMGIQNPQHWRITFYNANTEWCKKHKLEIDVRYRTPEDVTAKRNKKIVSEYLKGKTKQFLAEKYDVDIRHVAVILSDNGVTNINSPQRREFINRNKLMLKDYNKGLTYNEIAEKYDLTAKYVSKLINKLI